MQDVTNAIRQMRFPQKLWYLLDLHTDAILWGGTGRTILLNYRVLHTYLQCNHSIFKTTNISSFVRQLNLYGFRKVTSHLQDPLCNSSNPYMHEYMHDFFQFGRPELLYKITRKALTMKKSFKAKNTFVTNDQLLHLSPLQKARRALQVALKKAIQETYDLDSAKQSADQSCPTEYEDEQDDFQEEDNIELDWTISTEISKDTENNLPPSAEYVREVQQNTEMAKNSYGTASNGSLIHFSDDLCQHSIDNFTTPFLSMPDLESEPTEDNSGIEILAEFHIKNEIDQGITKKSEKENDTHSLNCVLPSVSNDQNDDITFAEPTEDTDHYHGEWDQMFCDIITNKSSSQDSVSNLKDLYSQISQTIDLLNS